MVDPKKLEAMAKKQKNSNLRFYMFLKRFADSEELDSRCRALHEELFAQYDCSACRNCCREMSAGFLDSEIGPVSGHLGLTREEFMEKYLGNQKEDEVWPMRSVPCEFLQSDGSCRLEDCKPDRCKRYPYTNEPDRREHLFHFFEDIFVCPVAYEINERLKKLYDFAPFDRPCPRIPDDVLPDEDEEPNGYVMFLLTLAMGLRYEEFAEKVNQVFQDVYTPEELDRYAKRCDEVASISDPALLVDCMRKEKDTPVQQALCKRALEIEEQTVPLILDKFKRNFTRVFLQTATRVLANASPKYALTLLREYSQIKSDLGKEHAWIVFGIQDIPEAIPLLMQEWERGDFDMDEEDEEGWMLREALILLNEYNIIAE